MRDPRVRTSYVWLTAGVVALCVGAAVISVVLDSDPPVGWVRAGSVREVADQRVTFIPEIPAYVVDRGERPIALFARSPQNGEPVRFCSSSGWFEDLLHGSMFDGLGRYVLGPAPRGLDRFEVHLVDNEVWIDSTNIYVGPPRGNRQLTPAGPFCRSEGQSESDGPIALNLPQAGVAVGNDERVVLIGLDGTIVAELNGYELAGNPGAPGIWLRRGQRYFELNIDPSSGGLLERVPAHRARGAMYEEGREPVLGLPPRISTPDAAVAGHWRYTITSSSGANLAQWSGECEVPFAYWIDRSGTMQLVTGGRDVSKSPESVALGWTRGHRAVAFLPHGGCGSTNATPGVYLYAGPGQGRLLYRASDRALADSWGLGL
jgi:hypothetical protein